MPDCRGTITGWGWLDDAARAAIAFANGALVERVSSNYGGGWEAVWLTDENPETGWAPERAPNRHSRL